MVQNLFFADFFRLLKEFHTFLFHTEIFHQIFIADAGKDLLIAVHFDLAFGTEIREELTERMFIFERIFPVVRKKVFFQVFVFFRIFFRKFFCISGVTEFVCVIGSFTVGSFAVDSCLIICVLGVGNFLRSSRFSVCSFLRSRYISNGIKHNVVSGGRCASFRFLSLR